MPDRRGLTFCIAVFVAARVALSLLGWAGVREVTQPPAARESDRDGSQQAVVVPGPGTDVPATPGIHNLVDGTRRWDGAWFLLIAEEGYSAEPVAAFFPAYPLSTRIVDELLPVGPFVAAVVVSNISFLLALVFLYDLTIAEYGDHKTARRTIALVTFFPTSFFFLAPYAEALYFLMSVLAFRAARRGRWSVAGIAGAVAWATRSMGGTIVPALALEAFRQRGPTVRRLAWAAFPVMGLLPYLVWWWTQAGDPFVPIAAQSDWYREPSFPLWTLGRGLAIGLRAAGDTEWLPEAGDVLLTAVPLAALVWGWKRLPTPSYALYAALGFVVPLSFAIPQRPLLSVARFLIVLFPIAWIAATALTSRTRYLFVLAVSIAGWVALALAFVNWRFVA
jgi:hypothetical protein